MTTIDDIITDVLRREGGFVNDPNDKGGPTQFGVTAATLGTYRKLGRPATVKEIQSLTEGEAREIYLTKYVLEPGFGDLPEWLRPLLVDDAVLSGQGTAVRTLQQVLGVREDGVLGPITRAAIDKADVGRLRQRLVIARTLRYARIIQQDFTQARFLAGWQSRALSFLG